MNVADGDLHAGPFGGKGSKELRGEFKGRGGEEAEGESPDPALVLADAGEDGVHLPEGLGSAFEQGAAAGGEFDLTGGANEEHGAQLLLELTNLGAQGLLGEVQTGGGAGEVELFGEDEKRAEVAEFHIHNESL